MFDFLFSHFVRKFDPLPELTDGILTRNVVDLAEDIRQREVSSVDVIDTYIARIELVNPILNCIVVTNFEAARRRAAEIEDLVKSPTFSARRAAEDTPFLGVPFTVKECFSVEGMPRTMGLKSLAGAIASENALVVQRMLAAGGVLLGITNVSSLCFLPETSNALYGTTRNPYDTQRSVSGSSGGEAAAVASGCSLVGIASDVGGSIRMPAFFNGVFGFKPSPGLVPNDGQIPELGASIQRCLSTGIITRYASDIAPIVAILSGGSKIFQLEERDGNLYDSPFFYALGDADANVSGAMLKVVDHLRDAKGVDFGRMEDDLLSVTDGRVFDAWVSCMSAEDTPTLAQHAANERGKPLSPFKELAKWTIGRSDHTLQTIGLTLSERKLRPNDRERLNRSRFLRNLRETLNAKLQKNGILLFPTYPRQAPFLYQQTVLPHHFVYAAVFNILGYPSCNVPLGLCRGLPLGIQVVATEGNDRFVLAIAQELERAFGGWTPPSKRDY